MCTQSLIVVGWTLVAVTSAWMPSAASAQSAVCAHTGFTTTRELRYVVNARVRPLLFWIGRSNVGGGRITWSRSGESDRLELLVGSDPSRTPMRVNRWGYIAETVCEAGADVVGVMTESEEASVEQASANVSRGSSGRQAFRSIRSRVHGGRSEADVARVSIPGPVTYHDLDGLLPAVLVATGEKRSEDIVEGTAPGFLAAVAELAQRALGTAPDVRSSRARLAYVYNAQLFDLELLSSEARGGSADVEFRTRNRTTGNTTKFAIAFDTTRDVLRPTRIRFRPRWWFEAELVLDAATTVTADADLATRGKP